MCYILLLKYTVIDYTQCYELEVGGGEGGPASYNDFPPIRAHHRGRAANGRAGRSPNNLPQLRTDPHNTSSAPPPPLCHLHLLCSPAIFPFFPRFISPLTRLTVYVPPPPCLQSELPRASLNNFTCNMQPLRHEMQKNNSHIFSN